MEVCKHGAFPKAICLAKCALIPLIHRKVFGGPFAAIPFVRTVAPWPFEPGLPITMQARRLWPVPCAERMSVPWMSFAVKLTLDRRCLLIIFPKPWLSKQAVSDVDTTLPNDPCLSTFKRNMIIPMTSLIVCPVQSIRFFFHILRPLWFLVGHPKSCNGLQLTRKTSESSLSVELNVKPQPLFGNILKILDT